MSVPGFAYRARRRCVGDTAADLAAIRTTPGRPRTARCYAPCWSRSGRRPPARALPSAREPAPMLMCGVSAGHGAAGALTLKPD
eukprot:3041893-Rhodomonas_salina.2